MIYIIVDTAMSGTSVDQRDNIEQCNIMIQRIIIIAHCTHCGK